MSPALKWLKRISFGVLVVLITFYTLFPFYWAVVSSLKQGSSLFLVEAWPKQPAWSNYSAVFTEQPCGRNLLNSVVVAGSVVLVSLFLAITAAFALARIRFRGRAPLMLMILGVSMFPQIAVLSGMFELIRALGLYNKLPALTLSYMLFTLPFTVWVLTTFMRELPKELEEAAVIDGASRIGIFWRIALPLSVPGLVTVGVLAFVGSWNAYLLPLLLLQGEMRTLPLGVADYSTEYSADTAGVLAFTTVAMIPALVLFLTMQGRIVNGLQGAVKG